MRIVFDTNILVLNLIGEPATTIIDAALTGFPVEQLSFFYSPAMMQEYRHVLIGLAKQNPAVFYPRDVKKLLADVKRDGRLARPTITLDACSHEPDNRFLECAVTVQADFLVTVNTTHFPVTYQGIRVIRPGPFARLLFTD